MTQITNLQIVTKSCYTDCLRRTHTFNGLLRWARVCGRSDRSHQSTSSEPVYAVRSALPGTRCNVSSSRLVRFGTSLRACVRSFSRHGYQSCVLLSTFCVYAVIGYRVDPSAISFRYRNNYICLYHELIIIIRMCINTNLNSSCYC